MFIADSDGDNSRTFRSNGVSGSGEIPGASAPFMTSYLMAALDATAEAEHNALQDDTSSSSAAQTQFLATLYGSGSQSSRLLDGMFA